MIPITRREKIIAGQDLKTKTREEWFLKKYSGGGAEVKKDISDLKEDVGDLQDDVGTIYSDIAETYDITKNYVYGDIRVYEGKLYKCIGATTGAFDPTKWELTTTGNMLETMYKDVPLDLNDVANLADQRKLTHFMEYGDQIILPWRNGTTFYDMPMNFVQDEYVEYNDNGDRKDVATFESHYVLPFDCVYDAPEAIYASASDLEAGDYYFKIVGDSWGSNTGKYVSFTLTEALTAGKQIRKKSGAFNADISDCTLGIFTNGADLTGETLAFTVSSTEPESGTSLGQTDGTGDLNIWACVVLGYNRWKYSAARQFLNSTAEAGNWWTQQHKWDVKPAYADTKDGYLKGFDAALLDYMKVTKVYTSRNTVFNSGDTPLGGMDETYDRVFLASLEQMYIEPQQSGEGDYWEYYKRLLGSTAPVARSQTYARLIKYDLAAKTTARYRWLRSATRGIATYVWSVTSSGFVYYNYAYGGIRLAPCLRIGL